MTAARLRHAWRAIRWPAGVLIGAVLTWLLIKDIDLADVWGHLARANFAWVLVGLLSTAGTLWAKTSRWRNLFQDRQHVAFRDLLGALLVGQLVNTAIPVRVGDVARASTLGGPRPTGSYILSTIVAEKLLDGIGLGLLGLVAVYLAPLPGAVRSSAIVLLTVSLALLAVWLAFALARGERLWAGLEDGRFATLARHGREPLVVIRRLLHSGVLLRLIGWTVLSLGLGAFTNFACLEALNIQTDWSAALAVLVVGQFGSAIPTVPGRIGIAQALSVVALTPYGVDLERAISFSILLYVLVILLPCLSGLVYLVSLRERARAGKEKAVQRAQEP